MKLLVIAHSNDISGGANRSLINVVDGMQKDFNVDVTVMTMKKKGLINNKLDNIGVKHINMYYHSICTKLMGNKGDIIRLIKLYTKFIIDFFMSFIIAFRIRNDNYDCIYTNTRLIYMGAFISKWLRIPHVWHIREFAEENGGKYIIGAENFMNNNADSIIVISKSLQKSLSPHIDKAKMICIYNGIIMKDVTIPQNKDNGSFDLLLTGRLVAEKGQLEALNAMKILKRNGYTDIKLSLAGSSLYNDIYEQELVKYIKENELNVELLGEVEDMSLLRAIVNVELVCAKAEAFGRVTIEGMQHGLLIIGANTGATPEIIDDHVTGLLYQQGSPDDLAKKIEKVYLDEALRSQLANNGLIYAKEKYTMMNNVNQIMEVIGKTVE